MTDILPVSSPVRIALAGATLDADFAVPAHARGVIVFAHGSGSGRHSPRNQYVARVLQRHGFATLLADLLTASEDEVDRRTAQLRFDIDLLADRVVGLVDWVRSPRAGAMAGLPVGLFGASTGAAAALRAAAARPEAVTAVVSRGGRPDLAGQALRAVTAPTLLLVGGLDGPVIGMNRDAQGVMTALVTLEIIPRATHLFEEPGTLEQVAERAAEWFLAHTASRYGRELSPAAAVRAHRRT